MFRPSSQSVYYPKIVPARCPFCRGTMKTGRLQKEQLKNYDDAETNRKTIQLLLYNVKMAASEGL